MIGRNGAANLMFGREEFETCLLCEKAGTPDRRWNRLLALQEPYGVLRCAGCGLRWLSPRPDAEGYRKLYSDENYFVGSGHAPEDYRCLAQGRRPYFAARVARMERACPGRQLSILDYGAATGEFVAIARARGHSCDGVELSEDARASASLHAGVELLSAEQALELPEHRYDVLHMNHVLEHMPDPLSHLIWCGAMLKPGGLLVAEVPQQFDNDLDRARRLLGLGGKQARFDAYSVHHTFFFSPRSLEMLARRAGFSECRTRTFNPEKTPWRPFSLRNWILRPWLGVADKIHSGGNIVEIYARSAR